MNEEEEKVLKKVLRSINTKLDGILAKIEGRSNDDASAEEAPKGFVARQSKRNSGPRGK